MIGSFRGIRQGFDETTEGGGSGVGCNDLVYDLTRPFFQHDPAVVPTTARGWVFGKRVGYDTRRLVERNTTPSYSLPSTANIGLVEGTRGRGLEHI